MVVNDDRISQYVLQKHSATNYFLGSVAFSQLLHLFLTEAAIVMEVPNILWTFLSSDYLAEVLNTAWKLFSFAARSICEGSI